MSRSENESAMLRVGDSVDSRFGTGKVEAITLTDRRYGKTGSSIENLSWELVQAGWAVVDLDNGHWQYGDLISRTQEEAQNGLP